MELTPRTFTGTPDGAVIPLDRHLRPKLLPVSREFQPDCFCGAPRETPAGTVAMCRAHSLEYWRRNHRGESDGLAGRMAAEHRAKGEMSG